MKKIIYNLRQKPEEERRVILHIFTFFVVVIMVTIWIFSLKGNLFNSDTQSKIKEDLQPFSVLKSNLVGGINNTQDTNSSVVE